MYSLAHLRFFTSSQNQLSMKTNPLGNAFVPQSSVMAARPLLANPNFPSTYLFLAAEPHYVVDTLAVFLDYIDHLGGIASSFQCVVKRPSGDLETTRLSSLFNARSAISWTSSDESSSMWRKEGAC